MSINGVGHNDDDDDDDDGGGSSVVVVVMLQNAIKDVCLRPSTLKGKRFIKVT